MTEAQQKFIEKVDRLEARYKGDKYAESVLMPLDLLCEVRDEMKQPILFEVEKEYAPQISQT